MAARSNRKPVRAVLEKAPSRAAGGASAAAGFAASCPSDVGCCSGDADFIWMAVVPGPAAVSRGAGCAAAAADHPCSGQGVLSL